VDVDFPLVLRVLTNLIDNAVKYSTKVKQVEIAARTEGRFVGIDVADRGVGIPPSDLKHVFEKFYSLRRPLGREGTGLGLSVCKGIVEAHGGTIRAENRSGGGTVIKLMLPIFSGDPHGRG
jgi:two-component system sensor histidine kinase KdpD